ncbi:hypothetical protein Hanom_Chr02g00140161 [Helianthus anomalus]
MVFLVQLVRNPFTSFAVCVYNVYMYGHSGRKSNIALILTLFYYFCENNIKSNRRLIMHHVVALIAKRQGGTCINQSLSRLLSVICLMSFA